MKKKALTLVLALMLVMSMAVPAMAADVTAAGSSSSVLTYSVDPGYCSLPLYHPL